MADQPQQSLEVIATRKDGSNEYVLGIIRKTARTWDTLLQDEGDRKFFCVVGEAHALSVWSCHTSDMAKRDFTDKVTVRVTMTLNGDT